MFRGRGDLDSQEGRAEAVLGEEHGDLRHLPYHHAPDPVGVVDEEDVFRAREGVWCELCFLLMVKALAPQSERQDRWRALTTSPELGGHEHTYREEGPAGQYSSQR